MIIQKPSGSSYISEIQQLRRQNRRLISINKELKSENRLLNQLTGSSRAGMYVKNSQNTIVYVNQSFCEHLQVDRKEILFKDSSELPKGLRKYTKEDKKVLKTRNVVFNLIENKEKHSWIETVKFPWIDSRNQLRGIYGFTYDVSERVKLEDRLKEEQINLKKANMVNEALRQFSYAASHDLQEPLRSVQGILKHHADGIWG